MTVNLSLSCETQIVVLLCFCFMRTIHFFLSFFFLYDIKAYLKNFFATFFSLIHKKIKKKKQKKKRGLFARLLLKTNFLKQLNFDFIFWILTHHMEVLNIFSCSLAAVHIFYVPNTFELRSEKTNISHMRSQRRRSASQ